MTHTPGDWRADGDEVWAGKTHICDCTLYGPDEPQGTDEDNAQFIGAATGLLAACEDSVALAESQGCQQAGCEDGWHSPVCPLGVVAPLYAAIAQAKGEAKP